MQKALLTLRYFSLCVPNIIFLRKEHLSFIGKALEEGKADRAGDFIKFLSEQQAVYGKLLDGKWFDKNRDHDFFQKIVSFAAQAGGFPLQLVV